LVTCVERQVQLRLGRDRCWYLLRDEGDTWVLREPPRCDPADLLRDAGLVAPLPPVSRRGSARAGDSRQLTLPW
ncbi:MAG TPA: hypothetical protein VKI64_09650, partial [Acidimicrobiales bacterium]|nr:hypothetical protein [Acidimicrobiales bacterium]